MNFCEQQVCSEVLFSCLTAWFKAKKLWKKHHIHVHQCVRSCRFNVFVCHQLFFISYLMCVIQWTCDMQNYSSFKKKEQMVEKQQQGVCWAANRSLTPPQLQPQNRLFLKKSPVKRTQTVGVWIWEDVWSLRGEQIWLCRVLTSVFGMKSQWEWSLSPEGSAYVC